MKAYDLPDQRGHFGPYGGIFVAETLTPAIEELTQAYGDRARWNRAAVHNTARSGYFSSDRTIREYAHDIWHIDA